MSEKVRALVGRKSYHLCWLLLLLVSCFNPVADVTRTQTLIPIPTESPMPNTVAGFSHFLTQIEEELFADRPSIVNRYVAQVTKTPLTADDKVIFLWRGIASEVGLRGDMNSWQEAIPLQRIDGTELWWLEQQYEATALLDYLFVVDGKEVPDPHNPRRVQSGFGPRSVLAMPHYQKSADQQPHNYPQGTIYEHTLNSDYLDQKRTFFVYVPAAELVGADYPSVYLHDGADYLKVILNTPRQLDYLIATRAIPPLVAVFIPPIDRYVEYAFDDDYANFVAKEVVPFVRETYHTSADPQRTATLGASMGGLISTYLGITQRETFGLVASQSGAFSLNLAQLQTQLSTAKPFRFYFNCGTYETNLPTRMHGDFLTANRQLRDTLEKTGVSFLYREYPYGHAWGFWADTLGEALIYLFSAE